MRITNFPHYPMTRVVLWMMLIVGVFGLTACGSVSQATGGNGTQGSATATSTSGVNMPSQVKVTTDKLQYTSSETLTVTVTNSLASNIFVAPYQTNCTPLLLEGKKDDGTWTAQNLCSRVQSASPQPLKAGSTAVYRLTPTFRRPGTAIRSTVWQPGTYRVSISYTMAPDPDTVQGGIKAYAQNLIIA